MSYWNKSNSISTSTLDATSTFSNVNKGGFNTLNEFYEIESAIVLDIILDTNHSYFKKNTLVSQQWPLDINGKPSLETDPDYTWIGRALVRLIYSNDSVEKEELVWAIPLESNISEYPLLNEMVGVVSYLGQYYYTRKINKFNTPNTNADFNLELKYGGFKKLSASNTQIQGNRELLTKSTDPKIPYVGPQSKLGSGGGIGYIGALGRYFYYNPRIRSLKRREGDLIFESRFGQSIRFAAYDDNRGNDKSSIEYEDYKGSGNPMIIIRNRQRPLNKLNVDEKNVGGYMLEDVNKDGTSIHLTSGLTLSAFQTTCLKKMWGNGEEQEGFNGTTSFKFPKLWGDQIVINSDRVIISAKREEMFQYSKKRMSFVTDDEYTVDAHNQIIFTTNNKTVINSPAIYLGEYDQTGEPVLLGQTTVNWMYELCNLLLKHTHWYKHVHPDSSNHHHHHKIGQPIANQTQTIVQNMELQLLRDNLQACLSRRVFVTGGGYAPGQDGENLIE